VRDDREQWSAARLTASDTAVADSISGDGITIRVHSTLRQRWVSSATIAQHYAGITWPEIVDTNTYAVKSSLELLKRGAEISLDEPSQSAVRFLFGYEVIIYRTSSTDFRLHIDHTYADALWSHFQQSTVAMTTD